jgi:TetR/AcrR family transcriptional regulator, regulator of autoinduction and epiphytic fitness
MSDEQHENEQTGRRYHSPRRLQQAETTRRAILQAARKLFGEHGYQATTLHAIAQEAAVAVPTLYAVFGSKPAILSGLVKSTGADADIRALAQGAFSEPDPVQQLRLAAKVMRSILERDADIIGLLWQAGEGDSDLAAAWQQGHRQRLARLGELMGVLASKNALKPELAIETATEILWSLSSPEIYRLLVRERGWTPQRYEDWLADTAITLLLRPV